MVYKHSTALIRSRHLPGQGRQRQRRTWASEADRAGMVFLMTDTDRYDQCRPLASPWRTACRETIAPPPYEMLLNSESTASLNSCEVIQPLLHAFNFLLVAEIPLDYFIWRILGSESMHCADIIHEFFRVFVVSELGRD